jgi:hypothetical protein
MKIEVCCVCNEIIPQKHIGKYGRGSMGSERRYPLCKFCYTKSKNGHNDDKIKKMKGE